MTPTQIILGDASSYFLTSTAEEEDPSPASDLPIAHCVHQGLPTGGLSPSGEATFQTICFKVVRETYKAFIGANHASRNV